MSTAARSSASHPPSGFPTTPSSNSPSQPRYDFFPTTRQARSNSLTNLSTHAGGRSPSPTLSLTSEATSPSFQSGLANSSLHSPLPSSLVVPTSRPKQRKQRLFNVDRKEICRYHEENPTLKQDEIAQRFQVERSTISKILKYKDKWLHVPEQESMRIAKHRPSKFPEIEEYLVQWLAEATEKRTVLTDVMIRNKAKELAKSLEIPEEKFKASSGWVENFKHRHGIRRGVWQGDGRNTMMARALGSGSHTDTVLSPLNPAFVENHEDQYMDEYHAEKPAPDVAADPHHGQLQASPVEQRSWEDNRLLTPHDDPNASPPPPPLPYSQTFIPAQDHHQDHHEEHHEAPLVVHSDHHTGSYDTAEDEIVEGSIPISEYQHVRTGLPPPATLRDAEAGINKLIEYLDGPAAGLITEEEREALNQIKCCLFAHGNDLPYTRPPKRFTS